MLHQPVVLHPVHLQGAGPPLPPPPSSDAETAETICLHFPIKTNVIIMISRANLMDDEADMDEFRITSQLVYKWC